jgi:hypothetical protein
MYRIKNFTGLKIAVRLQRYKRFTIIPPLGNEGEREEQPEVASPLIARSSQCAVRNDDRASAMRRLEKNPRHFFTRLTRFAGLSIMRRLGKNPKDFLIRENSLKIKKKLV